MKLINYTSAKGDKLQGALYLPANYEPGKKYPLLVTIYEKRSNLANSYVTPNETSTPNRSIYTSRGYAVFDPDIVYRVNDPGMSAVWCVIPAVKAAIATGMIDSANVGLWGHSWGGYQTAFLVTQTNIFKSAIAGAPLTDMVSMYGSIYWNTGGADQAIFESSQGRFKGNYADNYDAYIRNSPNFHAKNVKTPLIILANDKDGAVDFNQGITYFNTLRQMNKDVILLEYVGENHGLARPVNMKDYAMRQKDWFDHYLKGAPAPEWMTNGIPRIKMDEYWQQLKSQQGGRLYRDGRWLQVWCQTAVPAASGHRPPADVSSDLTPTEEPKDLGFGSVVGGQTKSGCSIATGRSIPRRDGLPLLRSLSFYHYFLTISWPKFFAIVTAGTSARTRCSRSLYLACGVDSLAGAEPTTLGGAFWRAFFFSVETIGDDRLRQHRAEQFRRRTS